MSTPNWPKLVSQGRAKAAGVPWSEEELKAIFDDKIPADYVRQGVLDPEEYEKRRVADQEQEKATGEKPLFLLSTAELLAKARALDLNVTADAPRDVLAGEIEKALTKEKEAEEKKAAKAKEDAAKAEAKAEEKEAAKEAEKVEKPKTKEAKKK